jgi:hypothetical protein
LWERHALTHWLALSKNAQNQECFQQEEYYDEDQRYELVQSIQGICLVGGAKGVIPVTGPAEASVERDVARANEDKQGGDEKQTDRYCSAVVEKLVAYGAV